MAIGLRDDDQTAISWTKSILDFRFAFSLIFCVRMGAHCRAYSVKPNLGINLTVLVASLRDETTLNTYSPCPPIFRYHSVV